MSCFIFLYQSPSLSFCIVFDSISSNIDEVLLTNPSCNLVVFGELTSTIRTALPILVELIDLVSSAIFFLSRIPDCDSHSPALLDLFLFSDASICSTTSDHVVKFPLTFHHICKRTLHCIAYDYSCVDWGGLRDHLRDVP